MSGLGPSFMKIWTCGSSPQSRSRNAWTRIKNVNGASRLGNFWDFFGTIQMISHHDWWLRMKPGYITMTRRQSNNQWSGGIAAHPTQKFWLQKSAGIVLVSIFFRSRRHPPHWLCSEGQTINAEYYSHLLAQLKDILKLKRRRNFNSVVLFLHDNPPLTGQLQPRKNWYT